MKKNKILLGTTLFVMLFSMTGCASPQGTGNKGGSQTIRVLNWEDYIYEQEDIEEPVDLIEQFMDSVRDRYPNVNVIYQTSDTNETMFNELQTGKANYDLICPSDYMIQKMITLDLLSPIDRNRIPNYSKYVSPIIGDQMDEITAVNEITQETVSLEDYAVGYMWGTLGILFNPEFDGLDVEPEEVIHDMSSWTALWDKKYKGTISIKDSMRDTYAAGVMKSYDEELEGYKNQYRNGEITMKQYNEILSEVFNRSDDETIELVKANLDTLKDNAFGLEVDSGKQDIVTGKIGVNIAWSGDAVYSIDQACDEEQVSDPFNLYYSIPENGSNIWFDGWVMPKNENRSQDQIELAHLFIDFLCDPANAAQNMNYIGYTPFVCGDSILETVRDWYDIRTDLIYFGEDYLSLYFIDPMTNEEVEVSYEHVHDEVDPDFEGVELYYYEDDEGEPITAVDEEGNTLYYNDLLIDPEWEIVDLSHYFNTTLDEYEDDVDTIFYSDEYLPFEYNGVPNISVGRQFFTQYPDLESINRCSVMRDFGKQNKAILKMWENFKSDPLPMWGIVLFGCEVGAIILLVGYLFLNKKIKISLRKRRIGKLN